MNEFLKCELCDREVERLTVHHLIPKQAAKRQHVELIPTAAICSPCHRQIHALFSNNELARELNSLEKLRNEPQMQKFLHWIRKQEGSKRVKVRHQK